MIEDSQENFFKENQPRATTSNQFMFPPNQLLSEHFSTFTELTAHIEKLSMAASLPYSNMYSRKRRGDYLYLKCRYCQSWISVKMQRDVVFVRFHNVHNHNNADSKKQQERLVMEYLTEELQDRNLDQAKLLVTAKFNLTPNRINYLWQKFNREKKFEAVLCYLQNLQYMIRTHQGPETEIPQIVLASSPSMHELYRKFGDVVTFDITYNLLRERSVFESRQWGLGIFSGFGANLEPVVFAFCLISRQTKECMLRLFQNTLEMLRREPSCFVTDQQLTVKQAIAELRSTGVYHGEHYFDTYHILKNLRKKTSKQAVIYYRLLLKARNQDEYESALQKLLEVEESAELAEHFDLEKSTSCFSKLEQRFVGFSASTSRGELINQLIKRKIPRQTNTLTLIRSLNRLFDRLNTRALASKLEGRRYEVLFGDAHLKEVRSLVGVRVFQQFLLSYVKGLRMQVQQISDSQFLVWSRSMRFCVTQTGGDEWECPCNFTIKTGTPCQHIIKVLWTTRSYDYGRYFSARWILTEQEASEAMKSLKSRGRPRNSRRNRVR